MIVKGVMNKTALIILKRIMKIQEKSKIRMVQSVTRNKRTFKKMTKYQEKNNKTQKKTKRKTLNRIYLTKKEKDKKKI